MCTPNNAVIQQERMHNAWHPDTDRSTGTFLPHCADRSSRSSSPSHFGPQRRHWERPMPATRAGRPRYQKAGRQGNDDTAITVLAWWYSLSLFPSFFLPNDPKSQSQTQTKEERRKKERKTNHLLSPSLDQINLYRPHYRISTPLPPSLSPTHPHTTLCSPSPSLPTILSFFFLSSF